MANPHKHVLLKALSWAFLEPQDMMYLVVIELILDSSVSRIILESRDSVAICLTAEAWNKLGQ